MFDKYEIEFNWIADAEIDTFHLSLADLKIKSRKKK